MKLYLHLSMDLATLQVMSDRVAVITDMLIAAA
jgi:hypothetical protein